MSQNKDNQGTKRWTVGRKKEAVMRLLQGEDIDDLSRELGVAVSTLDMWKELVVENMEELLKPQKSNPLHKELARAKKQIGELSMQVELLEIARSMRPFPGRRSKK